MAYRELGVFEVKEVLRLWARGRGLRVISQATSVDRKRFIRVLGGPIHSHKSSRPGGAHSIGRRPSRRGASTAQPRRRLMARPRVIASADSGCRAASAVDAAKGMGAR